MSCSHFDLDKLQPYSPSPSCMKFSCIMWNNSPAWPHFSYKTQALPLSKSTPDSHLGSCSMVKNTAITFQEVSPFRMPSIPSRNSTRLKLVFCPFTVYSISVSSLCSTECSQSSEQRDHWLFLRCPLLRWAFCFAWPTYTSTAPVQEAPELGVGLASSHPGDQITV